MGGSKPKAPKSETTTIVKQPDPPDPIYFQTYFPRESFGDLQDNIRFAQRQAGNFERASDMMGLSPQALGIQQAKTQAIQDAAYASSLPGGLSGSIYDVANKQAADSAANLEQVKKDAAGFDREFADDPKNLFDYGPANRDDDWLDFSTADSKGGGRRRRRRDDDDDDGSRRRGRRDDKKDKDKKDGDKKGKKRRKARKFSYFRRSRRHPDHYGPGSRLGDFDTVTRISRGRKGKTKVKRLSRGEAFAYNTAGGNRRDAKRAAKRYRRARRKRG